MTIKYSFSPVVDVHTRLLILGSLPGERSLAQAQYYAHPQNRFWALMGAVLGVDLVGLDYAQRLQQLLAHHVGLWDVVASARRQGSLDSQIREHTGNDIVGLVQTLPALRAIAFNGGTAARHGQKPLSALNRCYEMVCLPSSSPAYTLTFERKLERWQALASFL